MSQRKTTRREFAKRAAALAALPAVAGVASAGDPAPAPRPGLPNAATPAEALTAVVRLRHGRHLTAEQLQEVRQDIERNLRAAEALARVVLTNADEPDAGFSADAP